MQEKKIRWGILGAGAIAKAFADGVIRSKTGKLVAVGSRTQAKADEFAAAWGVPRAHGSYGSLLADPEVDAVYVATPHPMHPEWAIKAAEAGKHLLVEKPLAINSYLAQTMIEAAHENGVFLMEAYMYRCHPQTAKLVELIRNGVIGDVSVIQASFAFHSGFSTQSRLWNNALAGGGILDVGGYTTSIVRLIAGAAIGKPFAEPVSVTGSGKLHPETGVDCWAVGTMKFASGIVATITTGVGVATDNSVQIFGSKGSIYVPAPYVASRSGEMNGRIVVRVRGREEQVVDIPSEVTSYAYEADFCGRAILAGRQQAEAPAMSWDDTLGNLRAQDAWRAAIGLTYESEKPEALGALTPVGRRLARSASAPAPEAKIAHLDKPVSRLVLGVDNQNIMPHAEAVFDDFFRRGGNVFDTAHIYGPDRSKLLGRWIRARGVRDDVVIIAKGAHTPNCNPESLVSQLDEQLGWFGLESADIYMMHRDNLDIPVGKFIETLNDLVRAGKIKAFGGSNWTIDRVRKANAYAKRKGLQGFSVLSNNLSLAEMINPVWPGCLHVHDAASRAFLKRSNVALLPWSSQARGFFVPSRAHPDLREDASLVHCWYSEDNFKRQARAIELAKKKGVEPINIALAWVLNQPFPTFPLIGPRQISETRSCFEALKVELSARECKYLDLEI
ncbi:MAG: aldo/keto reductase [Kiritimatiellia bacterium]